MDFLCCLVTLDLSCTCSPLPRPARSSCTLPRTSLCCNRLMGWSTSAYTLHLRPAWTSISACFISWSLDAWVLEYQSAFLLLVPKADRLNLDLFYLYSYLHIYGSIFNYNTTKLLNSYLGLVRRCWLIWQLINCCKANHRFTLIWIFKYISITIVTTHSQSIVI